MTSIVVMLLSKGTKHAKLPKKKSHLVPTLAILINMFMLET